MHGNVNYVDRKKKSPSPLHLSLNCKDRWGTTDDFTTSFLLFFLSLSLFSAALCDLAISRPVHSHSSIGSEQVLWTCTERNKTLPTSTSLPVMG